MKSNMGEMLEVNSRTPMKKGAEPELKSMEHERSANGGHVFTHRMMNNGGGNTYYEPEVHTFGANEGKQALAHFAKHAGISENVKADKDSAAGAAT